VPSSINVPDDILPASCTSIVSNNIAALNAMMSAFPIVPALFFISTLASHGGSTVELHIFVLIVGVVLSISLNTSSSSFSAARKSIVGTFSSVVSSKLDSSIVAGTALSLNPKRTTVLESSLKIGISDPISSMWCINKMNPLLPEALDRTTCPLSFFIISNLFVPGDVKALKVSSVAPLYFFRLWFSATTSSHKEKIRLDDVMVRILILILLKN